MVKLLAKDVSGDDDSGEDEDEDDSDEEDAGTENMADEQLQLEKQFQQMLQTEVSMKFAWPRF